MATTQDDPRIPDGLLDHLKGLEVIWPELRALIPPSHPRNEGEGAGEGEGEGEGEGAGAGEGAGTGKGEGAGEGEGEGEGAGTGKEPDWKAQSRKHETRSKAEKKRADELQAKLDKIADSNKTEQQKAIDKAKAEAKAEVLTEVEKERRSDRLESAVTKLAAKAIKVGEESKRFADIDDAQVHIDRAIARGDLDADDIFDSEGKVQTDALLTALAEILESKPHLAGEGAARGSGSADAGKGSGSKDLDEMDVEAHLGAIKRNK